MRRIFVFIALLCLVCGLFVSANAANAAESIQGSATVYDNGGCNITLTVSLHLDQPVDGLKFPLPGNAYKITLNGKNIRGRLENGLRYIDLSDIAGRTAGNFTLTLNYSLPNMITTDKAGQPELQLPLLSGFAYPVQKLDFSVMLPGPITAKPAFSSGYHQANIEKDLSVATAGNMITGQALTELKDHETLLMKLSVPAGMFRQTRDFVPDSQNLTLIAGILSLVVGAYWLIFLRNFPLWPKSRATPPDGFDAGELGSALFLKSCDLNMMVFSWAQLGYLLIELKRNGKVILHRQMEMGNERSSQEQRYFKLLFGARNAVDTGTQRYADLCHKVERTKPNLSSLVHQKSGNRMIFRVLGAVVGALWGGVIGLHLSSGAGLQWVPAVLLGALAFLTGYHIQGWVFSLLSPYKHPLRLTLTLCAGWLVLGYGSGNLLAGLWLVLGQLIVGLLAAFGGRRTTAGKQAQAEALGLWRYLQAVPPEELRQICQSNPEYFHQMAGFAMALGVHKRFARRFGKLEVGTCPYLYGVSEKAVYAYQWYGITHRVLRGMKPHPRAGIDSILRKYLR